MSCQSTPSLVVNSWRDGGRFIFFSFKKNVLALRLLLDPLSPGEPVLLLPIWIWMIYADYRARVWHRVSGTWWWAG